MKESRLGSGIRPYYKDRTYYDPKTKTAHMVLLNARTGEVTRRDGTPVPSDWYDIKSIDYIRASERAKKEGSVRGEAVTEAQIGLPQVESDYDYMEGLVRDLVEHEGMPEVVGLPNVLTLGGTVWGTKGAGFRQLYNQIEGKKFLQAFETLKGGGHITEIEGEKATNALSSMGTAQSEDSFREAAKDFLDVIQKGRRNARIRAEKSPIPTHVGDLDMPPEDWDDDLWNYLTDDEKIQIIRERGLGE